MEGRLTISRPCYGDDRRKISIQVKDVGARITFLEVEIDYDKFTQAITGLSSMECDLTTRGLDCVGKTMETKPFSFPFPHKNYGNMKEKAVKMAKELCPEGWTVDTYFGSKDSFQGCGKDCVAHTKITRWV